MCSNPQTRLQINGVHIHNKCKLMNLNVRAHEVEVQLGSLADDGSVVPQEPFTVESVLFSVGRVPNTRNLNLQVGDCVSMCMSTCAIRRVSVVVAFSPQPCQYLAQIMYERRVANRGEKSEMP